MAPIPDVPLTLSDQIITQPGLHNDQLFIEY